MNMRPDLQNLERRNSPTAFSPSPPQEERVGERRPFAHGSLSSSAMRPERGVPALSLRLPRIPHRRLGRFLSELLRLWRNITMILDFSHHLGTAGSAVQCMPNIQQHPLAIFPPLMI